MANDRIEQYLEAILEKLNDGTETGVPTPAWRIEEYLAAIYDKCGGSSGGDDSTGGDGVLKCTQTTVNPAAKGATKGGGGPDEPDDPTTTTYYLDKKYSEIASATLAVVVGAITHLPIVFVGTVGSTRTVKTLTATGSGTITWTASSDNGYPSRTE